MSRIKTMAAIAAAGALLISLSACSSNDDGSSDSTTSASTADNATTASDSGSGSGSGNGELIGIAMPTKSLERWNNDGAHLQQLLEGMGYKTSLQYADNKVDQQITQIQNMINDGAKVLVIASIDGTALGNVLQTAADQGVKVIAYDRLINDTENVDYYATFDNYQVGALQGQYIIDQLKLDTEKGPFNLEPFAGSPDDNNAKFFFAGAWDLLKPYIDSGVLVVPSGKAPASDDAWASIGIQGWESAKAQSEMENRLNSFYTDKKVDVVLSPNDSLALGIEQALDGASYKVGSDWPIVTGQDADLANVTAIMDGKQSMSVFKNTNSLGDEVAKMVGEIVQGKEPSGINDTKTYDNGVKVVPTQILTPAVVTKENAVEILVDQAHYYTADQVKGSN